MIVPNGCDDVDVKMIEELVPAEGRDEAIVDTLYVLISWTDAEGNKRWRVYLQTDSCLTQNIGLLELGKLETVARTPTGLPLAYPEAG